MRFPLPLDPESPDVEVLPASIAGLLRILCRGAMDLAIDSPVVLPNPVSLNWAGLEMECDEASWAFDAGGLDLRLCVPASRVGNRLDKMFNVLNQHAELVLSDGSLVTARMAHLTSRGGSVNVEKGVATNTYDMSLDSWTWWPPHEHVWVGRLDRLRIDDGNLVVCGDGWSTSRNLRLTGNYDLYLVESRKARIATLVVDPRGQKLDQSLLATDFIAMEFALGHPMRLDYLLAVGSKHNVVGAAGVEFGGWAARGKVSRCPVAVSMDLYANYNEVARERLWIPVLFSLVASKLRDEGVDSVLLTGVAAYIDSIAAGNIHVSYLLVQIALEALSASIARPTSGLLVTDPKKWLNFVRQHESEIRSLAAGEEVGQKLVNKVTSAQHAPSTDRVAVALRHFGLDVPEPVLDEIARRNSSAHNFVMANESTADAQDLADRLAMVQTLLAAIVAKHVGFNGPIVGWEWVCGRHKIPDDWWDWRKLPEARRQYLVLPPDAELETDGNQERIAQAAYFRWLRRAGEHGHDVEDWLAAEREVDQE